MAGTCAKAVLGADACARPGARISALASAGGPSERASNPRLPEVPRSAAPTRAHLALRPLRVQLLFELGIDKQL
jgi:hypothetical protein